MLILRRLCEGRFWGAGDSVHSRAVPIEFILYGTEQYGYLLLEKFPARESSDRGVPHARVLGARVLLRGGFTVLRTPPRIRGGAARSCSALGACVFSTIYVFLCVAGVLPPPQSQPCPRSIP